MSVEIETVDLWLSESGQAFTEENDLKIKDHLIHVIGMKVEDKVFFRLDDSNDLYCKETSSEEIIQLSEKGDSISLIEKDLNIHLSETQSRVVKFIL